MHGFAQVGRALRSRRLRIASTALLQEAAIRLVRIGAHVGENIRPVSGSQRFTHLAGWPVEGGLATGGNQQDLVAHVQVGHRVRDHQHHAARVGELAQHQHHLAVQRRVQTGGGLVEQ